MSLRSDRELAADLSAQERADAPPRTSPVVTRDYVHMTHPETGVPVVFVPGEALPEWAIPAAEARTEDLGTEAPTPRPPRRSVKAAAEALEAETGTAM